MEALERHAQQFRAREELWPFRVPHEPLVLEDLIEQALAGEEERVRGDDLRSRTVISFDWDDGSRWSAWVITLPSGITLYCDADDAETRVLASAKRGSAMEADRFFLELLAISRGHAFGIEMAGGAPARVRTRITDRAFLTDVFVEMFEGTEAEDAIHEAAGASRRRPAEDALNGRDFTTEVTRWLHDVLATPTPSKRIVRTPARLADARAKRL
jgi:hypothetical protein